MLETGHYESVLSTVLEIKAVNESERVVEGYAAVFSNLDKNGDVIEPGAFLRTLAEHQPQDFAVFIGHQANTLPVGIPLEVRADARGLYTKTRVFRTTAGNDLLAAGKELQVAGQTLGMSIGFLTKDFIWVNNGNGEGMPGSHRRLKDIELIEYSFASPKVIANPQALVTSVKLADLETKPLPGEHSCRLRDPGDFQSDSFRRTSRKHDGNEYHVIMGRLKGEDTMTEQAYRYSKSTWSEAEARSHCRGHDGIGFEAASDEKMVGAGRQLHELAGQLDDLSVDVGAGHLAMAQLGIDTKAGRRMQGGMKQRVKDVIAALEEILKWAEYADQDEEAAKRYQVPLLNTTLFLARVRDTELAK